MKSLKKIFACLICAVLFATFFGCASLEKKVYTPSDEKFFLFTAIEGDGDEVVGYSVALNPENGDQLPDMLNLPFEYQNKPVVSVAEEGFANSLLKAVCIPSAIATVESGAFKNCKDLKKVYFYSDKNGCTEIKAFAFAECKALDDLFLPKKLQSIGAFAFSFTAIKSVEIPRPVKTIGDSAFAYCSNLAKVEIAVQLETVGNNVFAECADDLVIVVAASNPNFYAVDGELIKK